LIQFFRQHSELEVVTAMLVKFKSSWMCQYHEASSSWWFEWS